MLTAEVEKLGKAIESHPAFPERVNVGFMQIMNDRHIRLRVYERGVGETQACGTGACAAVATGVREGWLEEGVDIRAQLYGGSLIIRWQDGYPVYMTGPATFVYEGVFSPEGLMAGAGIKPPTPSIASTSNATGKSPQTPSRYVLPEDQNY